MDFDFDTWSMLHIEGISYLIVAKIRYKDKHASSNDTWTEYGLKREQGELFWLTVSEEGRVCTLSKKDFRSKPPSGYQVTERGTQIVVGVWGDSDVSVGTENRYLSYKSEDGKGFFFIEYRLEGQDCSSGKYIDPAAIRAERDVSVLRRMGRRIRRQTYNTAGMWTGVILLGFFLLVCDTSDGNTIHGIRAFFGVPYTMEERLSDGPYYQKREQESEMQSNVAVYTSSLDSSATALDLIEGVDGKVVDAYEVKEDGRSCFFISTEKEVSYVDADAGVTRIRVGRKEDLPPLETSVTRADRRLLRYAGIVYTGGTGGRDYLLK